MSEERVDRVLKALGEAELPLGLEARVLARVSEAQAKRPAPWFAWGLGGAVAAAAVAVVVGVHAARRVVQPAKTFVAAGVPVPPVLIKAPQPQASPVRRPRLTALKHPVHARNAEEAKLDSFPAPEAPLTEQEKLLVKVARNGDRNDFALLNPEQVQVAFAEEDAEMAEMERKGRLAPMKGEFLAVKRRTN